jgi:ribosomal protein S18 acetylase RimI-like enzyme
MSAMAPALQLRRALASDLDALERLETSFEGDRISRASFRRFLRSPSVDLLVAEAAGVVVGDAVVVTRQGFRSARLYSLVVAPGWRGRGVASALLAEAERSARERGCITMRLEVRADNAAAVALYQRQGYDVVGRTAEYYEDGSDALRMRKRFVAERSHLLDVPYYAQTLAFTCGPAALMMAMRAVGWREPFSRALEVALWREATTVYMQSGHGGTSAHGLAVAARRRGVRARVWVDDPGPPFVDSVRHPDKKAVIALAHEAFQRELAADPRAVEVRDFGADDVVALLRAGSVPVVLVSGARLYAERVPHWVVATGWDAEHLYLHDPHVPEGAQRADSVHLALPRRDFARVARFGRARHRAMVVVGPDERRPRRGGRGRAGGARSDDR